MAPLGNVMARGCAAGVVLHIEIPIIALRVSDFFIRLNAMHNLIELNNEFNVANPIGSSAIQLEIVFAQTCKSDSNWI